MKLEERGLIFDATKQTPNQRVNAFTTLCRLKSGTILAGFQSGTAKHAIDSKSRVARSTDGGRTWKDLGQLQNSTLNGVPGTMPAADTDRPSRHARRRDTSRPSQHGPRADPGWNRVPRPVRWPVRSRTEWPGAGTLFFNLRRDNTLPVVERGAAKIEVRGAWPPRGVVPCSLNPRSVFRYCLTWLYLLDASTELEATRNPRESYRIAGVSPSRPADRQLPAPLLQPPPRSTRFTPTH